MIIASIWRILAVWSIILSCSQSHTACMAAGGFVTRIAVFLDYLLSLSTVASYSAMMPLITSSTDATE